MDAESDREARTGHQDKREKRHYCRLPLGRSWEFAVKVPTKYKILKSLYSVSIKNLAEGTEPRVVSLETSWW